MKNLPCGVELDSPDISVDRGDTESDSGSAPRAGTGTELFFDFGTPPLIFRVIPERLPSLDNNLPVTSDGPSDVPLASWPWQSLQVA